MRLSRVSIAASVVGALFAMPSIAQSLTLTHPTGTVAPVGTKILATNVAHAGTLKTIIRKTSLGNLECETATWTGELTKNSGGLLEAEITTVEFSGKSGSSPHTATCNSGFGGDVTVTPNHATNPTHNGVTSLPWCLKAGAEKTFTVRGGKCSEASRALTFQIDTTSIGTCNYQKAQITGTITAHPADLIGTIAGQSFSKITGGVFCPGSYELFMALTFATDVNGVSGAQLYLDE